MKQLALFSDKPKIEFGGSLFKQGRRKVARPLDSRAPIHLVLKAQNTLLLFQSRKVIANQMQTFAKTFSIRIYSLSVNADHIHCVIKISNREGYRGWIRAVTGTLARAIPKLKWKLRPYSRILTWGMQFRTVMRYVALNVDETEWRARMLALVSEFVFNLVGPIDKPAGPWRSLDPPSNV